MASLGEKVSALCKQIPLPLKSIAQDCGLSSGVLQSICSKKNPILPDSDTISKLADYFYVDTKSLTDWKVSAEEIVNMYLNSGSQSGISQNYKVITSAEKAKQLKKQENPVLSPVDELLQLVGKRFREMRRELGLNIKELSAQSGCSIGYISLLEKGRGNNIRYILALCDYFKLPASDIFNPSLPVSYFIDYVQSQRKNLLVENGILPVETNSETSVARQEAGEEEETTTIAVPSSLSTTVTRRSPRVGKNRKCRSVVEIDESNSFVRSARLIETIGELFSFPGYTQQDAKSFIFSLRELIKSHYKE